VAQRQMLVLIPGLLCDAVLWRNQIAALSDLADCWVADHTRSDSMSAIAADVLREAPSERFALAGLSMGGYIALEVMRQAGPRVSRLALLDTSARADAPDQSQRRLALISLARRGRFLGVTQALVPLFLHPAHVADRELVTTVIRMARNTGADAFIREEQAIIGRADSVPLLAGIRCPTLVLCGRQDTVTPVEHHEEIAGRIAGSRLEIVEDCGHLSTLECPAEVSAALRRWLSA